METAAALPSGLARGARFAGPLRPQALGARACKPQAPIALDFEVLAVPGADHLLRVRWSIEPRVELDDVSWVLELPTGLTPLGADRGSADSRALVATHGELMLEVTAALSDRPGAAQLALVVDGSLKGFGGAEQISRRSLISLGAPDLEEPTLRHFVDTETGARRRVAVLPVAHRNGR